MEVVPARGRDGPDIVPAAPINSLYRTLRADDADLGKGIAGREIDHRSVLPLHSALARSLILGANDSKQALAVAEAIADGLEGKPGQRLHPEPPHPMLCRPSSRTHRTLRRLAIAAANARRWRSAGLMDPHARLEAMSHRYVAAPTP
jgi:hypothetical protein